MVVAARFVCNTLSVTHTHPTSACVTCQTNKIRKLTDTHCKLTFSSKQCIIFPKITVPHVTLHGYETSSHIPKKTRDSSCVREKGTEEKYLGLRKFKYRRKGDNIRERCDLCVSQYCKGKKKSKIS